MDNLLVVFWTFLAGWQGIMHDIAAEVTFIKLQKRQYFDGLVAPSGYIERWHLDGNDHGKCAARCRLMKDCVSFFIDRSTSVCQFHSTILRNTADMTSSANSTYYIFNEGGACPDGSYAFRTSCYMIEIDPGKTFNDAKIWCAGMGGNLLHVDDAEEVSFLKEILSTMSFSYFYIGLTDESVHGTWVWDDNGAVATFTDWEFGQPQMNDEHCAAMHRNSLWHDVNCNSHLQAICEF